jgi:hypothetical protein
MSKKSSKTDVQSSVNSQKEKGTNQRPANCPKCKSPDVLQILYGMPPAPKPGERFHYAGCNVEIGGPEWHCEACGHEWGAANLPD